MVRALRRRLVQNRKHSITVMVVPTSRTSVRSLTLPYMVVYITLLVVLGFISFISLSYLAMGASVARLYKFQRVKDAHIVRLQEENSALKDVSTKQRKQLESFAQKTALIEAEMAKLENLSKEVWGIVKGKGSRSQPPMAPSRGSADRGSQSVQRSLSLNSSTAVLARGTSPRADQEVERRLEELLKRIPVQEKELKYLKQAASSYRRQLDHTPSIWPARGRVTSSFGYRRHPVTRQPQLHTGIDIAVPKGTPVRATANGVVEFAGRLGGYGLLVIVNHGQGLKTYYGHNSRNSVARGKQVSMGQIIAYAGSTGTTTGTNIHYEVRIGGRPVDPRRYIR